LGNLPGVTIYAPRAVGSTLLFNLENIPSERVAEQLNRDGICLRAGFHCAPLGHATLATGENGAVRVGFSVFNVMADIEKLVHAIRRIRSNEIKRT
ncbi:MAG: aminotransferase class V-fold PLP-dependent enzyme, partial [Clostridia bacterium]|nr:aminotransferase class V-fold PLP-dependent enzyme [Clostridia bacterium]